MMPDTPFWWILGGAAALSAWWVFNVFGASINTEILVKVMEKLVREKRVSRAMKLAAAAGDSPVAKAVRAALQASVSLEEDEKRPVGYRDHRPEPMDAVRIRIRGHYDEAFSMAVASVQISFFLALISPLFFVGAAVRAFSLVEPNWPVVGVGSAGFVFWLYVGWSHIKILAARNAGFDALWPSFEALYHDRHAISLEDQPENPWTPSTETNSGQVGPNSQIVFEILEPGKPLRSLAFDQPIIKIGRLASSHIQLEDEKVARLHAVVELSEGKAEVIDLGAKHQTTVNLEPVQKRELANGDVIGIGDVELVVRLATREA